MAVTNETERRKALLAEAHARGEAEIAAAEEVRMEKLAEGVRDAVAGAGEAMSVAEAVEALREDG